MNIIERIKANASIVGMYLDINVSTGIRSREIHIPNSFFNVFHERVQSPIFQRILVGGMYV